METLQKFRPEEDYDWKNDQDVQRTLQSYITYMIETITHDDMIGPAQDNSIATNFIIDNLQILLRMAILDIKVTNESEDTEFESLERELSSKIHDIKNTII